MKRLFLFLILALPLLAQQIPRPPVITTGPIGQGGPAFPFFNNGTINMTSNSYTMVYPDQTASIIRVTGTLTAAGTIIAPQPMGFEFVIINATTGGFPVTLQGTGTGVSIPNGSAVMVVSDGVNYVPVGSTGGGGAGPITSPLIVPSADGVNNLTITVPNSGAGNPVLSSSTGTINIASLFVSNLAGTGPSCLQTDNLGNVSRTNSPCLTSLINPISSLTAANKINTIFNGIYQQNWSWHFPSTVTNSNGLNLSEQDLGAGTGNSVVRISSFAGSPTAALTVTGGANSIVSSGGITSDTSVSAPAFFTCTTASPCITPAAAPLGRATGGEPLATVHLHDFSTTAAANGQVPIWNSSLSQYVPGTVTGTGGGGSPTFPVTTHTGNYSPTVSAFDTCPTHVFRNVVTSAVVTLPNPAPASGKCMKFLNLGGSSTVAVIINSNNRTVNGATSVTNILIPAPTANNGFDAVGVMITSDGTNYVMENYSPIPVLSDLGNPNKTASWTMGNYGVVYNWNYATAQAGGLTLNGSPTATGTPTLFTIYSTNAATTLMDIGASYPNGFKVPASTGNIVLGGTSKLVGPVQLPTIISASSLGTDPSGNIIVGTPGGGGGPVRWSDLQNPAPYANLNLDMAGNGTEFDFGSGGDGVRGLTLSEYYHDVNANVGTMLKIYTSSPSVSPMEVAVGDGSGFSVEGNTGSMQFWANAKVEAPLRLTLAAPVGGGNPVANAASLGTDADGNIIPKSGGAAGLLCNNFTAGAGQTTAPVSLISCTPSVPLVVGGHYRIEAALRVVAAAAAGASTVTINQGGVGGTVVCPSGGGTTPAASTLDGLLQCEFTVTSSTSAAVFQPVYVMSAPGGGNNFWRTAISSNNQTITTTGTPTIDVVASTIGANSTWTGNSLVIYRLY